MGKRYKPKHSVLREFTKLLYDYNPMELKLESHPSAKDEYESEALSILARFNEAPLLLCADPVQRREIACLIVNECFEFWFQESLKVEPYGLAVAMLESYLLSYPLPEQATPPEVPGVQQPRDDVPSDQ